MKDGIHENLSIVDYHNNNTHYSSTQIKRVKGSLSEFIYYENLKQERKTHFDFGNAFETALLEPDLFDDKVVIFDDDKRPEPKKNFGSTLNKEYKKRIYDTDKYVIEQKGKESFETIEYMLESCYKDSVIQSIIKDVGFQTSLFWTDKVTGLKLKTRPDIIRKNKNVIIDVKTILNGSPQGFSKQLGNLSYPMQACLQMRGVVETGLKERIDNYFWLVVEKNPPFNATLYEFDKEDWEFCFDELDYNISRLSRGLKENKFIGYTEFANNDSGVLKAQIPLWYRNSNINQ